jgi:hypothetical protein
MALRLSKARETEIVTQGARQFMAIFEIGACRFKAGTVEYKLWTRGFIEARNKWDRVNGKKKFGGFNGKRK